MLAIVPPHEHTRLRCVNCNAGVEIDLASELRGCERTSSCDRVSDRTSIFINICTHVHAYSLFNHNRWSARVKVPC